jgi:hypothetical protein
MAIANFFEKLKPLHAAAYGNPAGDVSQFDAFFEGLAPLFRGLAVEPEPVEVILPAAARFDSLFAAIREPMFRDAERGGRVNPWQIAGLKRDEVRISAALAGLWTHQLGGAASRRFLSAYLSIAVPDVDWDSELSNAYRVETEINPAGDMGDRVDVVVETTAYVIGIEVKIDAPLGPNQLERYQIALLHRAHRTGREPVLIFLARSTPHLAGVHATNWKDVAHAARATSGQNAFEINLIHRFGDFIASY